MVPHNPLNPRHNGRATGRLLLLLALLLLFLAGCQLLSAGEEDDCSSETSLFEDDFSGEQDCGWVLYNRGGAVAAIAGGVMQLSTSQVGSIWWTNPGEQFDDVVLTVDAQQISGPNNNAYGLICRYQDEQNFYLFLISGDGYYAIGKYQSGSEQVIYLPRTANTKAPPQ
jgi:hypothetical protein